MNKKPIRLGVNIDHVATLRQVRGGQTSYPDLLQTVQLCRSGGADQITIHLREDRRHIQVKDLVLLTKHRLLPINLEIAAHPRMVQYARKYKPDWCCFVPEKRKELTTEGGLDVEASARKLSPMIDKLQRVGIEVSLFIDPSLEQIEAAYQVGADAVEFHTGKWVRLKGSAKQREWLRLCRAARLAHGFGLRVHAGHGLDYTHTQMITKLPFLAEVNIGHSIVCYSLVDGFKTVVAKMKKIIRTK